MLKRKFVSLFILVSLIFCSFSCGKNGAVKCELLENTSTRAAFRVSDTDGKSAVTDCMKYLSENADGFSYEISGGMVTEINGTANKSDFSSCWMLYTSDADMSNAVWGTIEYDGQTLGSAILGTDALIVETGEIYVWEYVTF